MTAQTERILLAPVAWYLRHSPYDVARWRLQQRAVRWSNSLRGVLGSRLIQTRHGFPMHVDGDSQVGRILYATGEYEREIASLIARLLAPGDTFIDGGAHVGFFSVLASRCVGGSGRVLAFEPAAATRERLTRNLRVNACGNVQVRAQGLGHATGRAVLSQTASSESGQMTLRPVASSVGSEDVDVVALDGERASLAKVRVIKLDLEGSEMAALAGMRQLLHDQRPDIIVEVTDTFLRAAGSSGLEMYRELTALGYVPFIVHHDRVERVDSLARWEQQLPEQFNALFTVRPHVV